MKYAVIADIHANIEAFEAVVEAASSLSVDGYICIGDIVGYNAAPKQCLDLLTKFNHFVVVRGNHDEYAASDASLIGFNPQAAHVVDWTRGQLDSEDRQWLGNLPFETTLDSRTMIVHATLDVPKRWGYVFDHLHAAASFNYQFTPLCFFGHTHIPCVFDKFGHVQSVNPAEFVFESGHKYMINPGSVGQPRDGNWRAAFATYEPEERLVNFYRVEYDLEASQKRIREAMLPERCAIRLASGK